MRQLMAVAVVAWFVSPALAENWKTYENGRFGFTVEIPAEGWIAQRQPANASGLAWFSEDNRSSILAWGANLKSDFKTEFAERVDAERQRGKLITGEAGWNVDLKEGSVGWYTFTTKSEGRKVELKAVVACSGTITAYVRLEYWESDTTQMLPMRNRLFSSLKVPSGEACNKVRKPQLRQSSTPA